MVPTDGAASVVVTLNGPAVTQGRIAVHDLALVLVQFQGAVQRIALVLRGQQGMRSGRRPKEVEKLTRLEVVGLRPGSVTLEFGLAETARPFQPMDIGLSAIVHFVEGIGLLADGLPMPMTAQALQDRGWDVGVLLVVKKMGTVLRRGIERIVVEARVGGVTRRAQLEPRTIDVIGRLMREPVRNLRTVEGRLLMADFKESATKCRVHPPMGPPVECSFDESRRQLVLDGLTHYVRVTGDAEIDEVSGKVRVLKIADLEILDAEPEGREGPYRFWEPLDLDELARIQGVEPVTDLASLAAPIWESDEELHEFLDDVYRARRQGIG